MLPFYHSYIPFYHLRRARFLDAINSPQPLNAIKEDPARWVELLKKIKVADVSSQNRAARSPGAYVQQSII